MDLHFEQYSFEVVNGPVGINLQSVRNGNGVFIESFYRSDEGATLAAEKCGTVIIGDRLESINNTIVWGLTAEAVRECFVQSAARGPFSVTVRRIYNKSSLWELIGDPRCSSWLNIFLQSYCIPVEAEEVARKIGLVRTIKTVLSLQAFPCRGRSPTGLSSTTNDAKHLCTDCIVSILENPSMQDISDALVLVVESLVHDEDVPLATLLDAVRCVLCVVEKELARTLLLKFENCSLARQMSGWLSESPAFSHVTMTDILRVDALLVLYYLFLCQCGRHRLVGALLRKRRLPDLHVASDRAAEDIEELQKAIILEAAREDLLFEFHASEYFDQLLASAGGRPVHAVLAETGPILQQVLRGVPLPPGVSLHRRRVCGASITVEAAEAAEAATVHMLLFRTTFGADGARPVTHVSASASACEYTAGECTVVNGNPFDEDISRAAPFLLPTGVLPSGEKLFSYVVAKKNGAYMYGASLVQPITEVCKNVVERAPLPVVKDETLYTDADTGGDSIPTSIFTLGPPAHAFSRMTDGAGQLLRGIRQWGESSLPPVVRVPSLSSVRSFSSNTPTSGSVEPTTPLTPFLWEMGSTISSVWMKPTVARFKTQEEESDEPDNGLWDAGPMVTPQQPVARQGNVFGVALLSTRPTVDTLRKILCSTQRNARDWAHTSDSGDAVSELAQVLSEANMLQQLSGPDSNSTRRAATDFNLKAVYEILSPQNLATIFCAALLEFKILLVSSERVTLALLVGEWLKLAMDPLEWCHVYAPVVPQHMALELVQCPAPYLLGIERGTLRAARTVPPRDVVVVDLDNGTVRVPAELKALLPAMAVMVGGLVGVLQPHSSRCDSVDSECGTGDTAVLSICRNFLRNLLCSVQRCVVVLEASDELLAALDEEKFVRKARAALCPNGSEDSILCAAADLFLRRLIRSQSFSENLLTVASQTWEEQE